MTAGLVAGVLLSIATGFVLTSTCVCDAGTRRAPLLLVVSLAVGLGLGVSACAFFVWMAFVGRASRWFAVVDVTLLAVVLASPAGRCLVRRPLPAITSKMPARCRLGWVWRGAVVTAIGAAAALIIARSLLLPHGGWDAWMTWNVAARFLFRGEAHWRDLFSPSFRHPDYPLLVPSAVARLWTYMGVESVSAPATIGLLFTFATIALAGAALLMLRTPQQAAIAALLLLGTQSFVTYGASQYADVPLAFFVLATVVLIFLYDRDAPCPRMMALGGACAAFAAWTKNEGGLFLMAIVAARAAAVVVWRGWRTCLLEVAWFTAGAAPVLAIVTYFKVWLAPANDLASGQSLTATLPRLFEADRYLAVARVMASEVWRLGHNGILGAVPLVVLYMLWMRVRVDPVDRPAVATSLAAVALVLGGYVMALVTAPGDFLRLLNSSADRLLLHVWPTIVFTCFMVARAPEDAGE